MQETVLSTSKRYQTKKNKYQREEWIISFIRKYNENFSFWFVLTLRTHRYTQKHTFSY